MKFKGSKKFISLFLSLLMIVSSVPAFAINASAAENTKYLFAYFTGNSQSGQKIRFAVSENGYDFSALNSNQPVVEQTKGSSSTSAGYARDPYIARAQNGGYYMIATDMDASKGGMHEGWTGDTCFVVWHSTNLTDWTQVSVIDFRDFSGFENTIRAWAPQFIYDSATGQYMIYISIFFSDWSSGIYYTYTSDFKNFTAPKILFKPDKGAAIDADIVDANGTYYMYYKDESSAKIWVASASSLTGTYTPIKEISSGLSTNDVEGNAMYQIADTGTWVIMLDEYNNGTFAYGTTTDFTNFTKYTGSTSKNALLSARHGSVMQITDTEYKALVAKFGGSSSSETYYHFDFDTPIKAEGTWLWGECGYTELNYKTNGTSGSINASNGYAKVVNGGLLARNSAVSDILNSGEFTASFTYRLDASATEPTPVFNVSSGAKADHVILKSDGSFAVNGTTATGKANIEVGQLNNFAVIYNGSSVQLYQNAQLVAEVDTTLNMDKTDFYAGFGFSDLAGVSTSTFSRIRFSNKALNYETYYGELVSLMKEFETKLNSGKIYTDIADAYKAYVKAQKAADAYYYGGDTSVDITGVATSLRVALERMNKEWSVKTNPTSLPKFPNDEGTTSIETYSNVLWGNTASNDVYSGKNANINYYVRYPEATFLYTGADGEKLKSGIGFCAAAESTAGSKTRYICGAVSNNSNISLAEQWHGNTQSGSNDWNLIGMLEGSGNNSKFNLSRYTTQEQGTTNAVIVKNGGLTNNWTIYFGSVMQLSPIFSEGEYSKDYKPNLLFMINSRNAFTSTDGGNKTTGEMSTALHVVNYKPLKEKILSVSTVLQDVANYSEGGLSSVVEALDSATEFDPNTYFASSNDYQGCAAKIQELVNAFPTASYTADSTQYQEMRNALDNKVTDFSGYTVGSVNEYNEILASSQAYMRDVYANGYTHTTEVSNNVAALDNVLNTSVDKSALQSAVDAKNGGIFDETGKQLYTYDSWANVVNPVLADAKVMLEKDMAKYNTTDATYNDIQAGTKSYNKVDSTLSDNQTKVNEKANAVKNANYVSIDNDECYNNFNAAVTVAKSIDMDKYTSDGQKAISNAINTANNTVYAKLTDEQIEAYNSATNTNFITANTLVKNTTHGKTDLSTTNVLEAVNETNLSNVNKYTAKFNGETQIKSYGETFRFTAPDVTGADVVVWTVEIYNTADMTGNPARTQVISYEGATIERMANANMVVTYDIKKASDKTKTYAYKIYNAYNNLSDVIYSDTLYDNTSIGSEISNVPALPFYKFKNWKIESTGTENVYKVIPQFEQIENRAVTVDANGTISVSSGTATQAPVGAEAKITGKDGIYGWAVVNEDGKYEIVSYNKDYKFNILNNEKYVAITKDGSKYLAGGVELTPANVSGFTNNCPSMTDDAYLKLKLDNQEPFVYLQAMDSYMVGTAEKQRFYVRVTADANVEAFGIAITNAAGKKIKFASTAKNPGGQFYMTIAKSLYDDTAKYTAFDAYVSYSYEYTNAAGTSQISTVDYANIR